MGLFGKRRSKKKNRSDQMEEIVYNLEMLARVEDQIADFYSQCAKAFHSERAFWEEMAASEQQHAACIRQMKALISDAPDEFKPGQEFTTASIRLFEMSIRELPHGCELEKMPREELLTLVLEIENSALETCYSSIVETENAKFKSLAGEIDRETNEHRQYLGELLEAEQSGEVCGITKSAQNS